jgi:Tfp pilus assembly protein PilF
MRMSFSRKSGGKQTFVFDNNQCSSTLTPTTLSIARRLLGFNANRSVARTRGCDIVVCMSFFLPSSRACYRVRILSAIAPLLVMAGAAQAQQQASSAELNARLRAVVAMANSGDEQGALTAVKTVAQQYPHSVQARKIEGMLLEDLGDEQGAAAVYRAALRDAPTDGELNREVGIADLVEGNADEAVVLLRKAAHAAPRDAQALFYLAQAYRKSGDDALALTTIAHAAVLDPKSAPIAQKYAELLMHRGQDAEAESWLERAKAIDPATPMLDYDFAVAAYHRGENGRAAAAVARALQQSPSSPEVRTLDAFVQVKLGAWAQAQAMLESLVRAAPQDASLQLQLGYCQLQQKAYADAVQTLQHARALDPTQPLTHFYLSRADAGLGDSDAAHREGELYQSFLQELSHNDDPAAAAHEQRLIAQMQARLAQSGEAAALQVYTAQIGSTVANQAGGYVQLCAIYLQRGNMLAATQAASHALRIDARARGAHTYLGVIALQQNDLAIAEREFEAELALDPNHPYALAELGVMRYQQGQWQDAIRYLRRSKITLPRFLYMLTDALYRVGDTQRAAIAAESLAAFAHGDPQAIAQLQALLERNGQQSLYAQLARKYALSAPQ